MTAPHMGNGGCIWDHRIDRCICRTVLCHEAGHVVACRAFGVRVLRVDQRVRRGTFNRRGGSLACVQHEDPRSFRVEAIIALAGPVAEQTARALLNLPPETKPGSDEFFVAKHFTYAETEPLIDEAQRIVIAHWPDIHKLADQLHARPLMFGAEIRAVLGSYNRNVETGRAP